MKYNDFAWSMIIGILLILYIYMTLIKIKSPTTTIPPGTTSPPGTTIPPTTSPPGTTTPPTTTIYPPPGTKANAAWIWNNNLDNPFDNNPTTVANNCTKGKINLIIPWVGHWNADGTITYLFSTSKFKSWINSIKAVNSNLKILACVSNTSCYGFWDPVDISNPTIRNKMTNEMINCVNTYGFDGFNEDTECAHEVGGFQPLVQLWNQMEIEMKNRGKIFSADIQNWGDYINVVSKNANIDYLMPMLYNGGGFIGNTLKNAIHSQLVNSKSPLVLGIGQYTDTPTLSSTLSQIDSILSKESNISKLAGFAIYEYGTMTDSDWNTWNSWSTKDKYIDTSDIWILDDDDLILDYYEF